MKTEIPVCTRCCFCLPLRYGLIAWGYFKLIAAACFIAVIWRSMYDVIMIYGSSDISNVQNRVKTEVSISILAIIVFVTDCVVTLVFIVGGHMKNVKLIRIFYFFSIAMLVLTILLIAVVIKLSVGVWMSHRIAFEIMLSCFMELSTFFVTIAVETYFLLLLRSEILKLRNNCEVNEGNEVSAEAECTSNEGGEGEETNTEACETNEAQVTPNVEIISSELVMETLNVDK